MLLPLFPRARIARVHHQPSCFTWMLSLDLRSSSVLSKHITHRACSTQVSGFQGVFFFPGSFEFAEFLQNQCGTPAHLRLLLFRHLSQVVVEDVSPCMNVFYMVVNQCTYFMRFRESLLPQDPARRPLYNFLSLLLFFFAFSWF